MVATKPHPAESLAAKHLAQMGLTLVEQNYHLRFGEIDLIMRDQNLIVFVEVRFRKISRFGGAIHSISRRKQSCLMRSARLFLQQYPQWSDHPCRFDVIAYDGSAARADPRWVQAAFN